jgi:hypothetical protein
MVAFTQQFIATAPAHELMAILLKARRRIRGSDRNRQNGEYQSQLRTPRQETPPDQS